MAILWVGGEDIDFPYNMPGLYPSGAYRSGYARNTLRPYGSSIASRGVTFPGGAVTSLWIGSRAEIDANKTIKMCFLGVGKTGETNNNVGLWLGTGSVSNRYAILKHDGTTATVLAEETVGLVTNNVLTKMDMRVQNYNGANCQVDAYLNGNLIVTWTGDPRVGTMVSMDCALLTSQGGSSPTLGCYQSEIIVADEDTRALSLVTLAPNASGDADDWSGDFGDIDDNASPVNDADVMYHNVNDGVGRVNLLPTPTGNFIVKAVGLSARATRSSDSTPTKIALGVKTGGTDYPGSDQALTTAWATYQALLATNPGGGNWTTAQLDALQLLMKARA